LDIITKIRLLNIPTKISIAIGLIIIIAGIYYSLNDFQSSGVRMGESGEPYGVGIIDGKGMIFCGVVIIALFYMIFNRKLR
jgi:hypothetical protein